MSSQLDNESVVLPKNLYVLNVLGMGVAIQMLARITGEEIEEWKECISAKANEQYRQLSSEEIHEIVDIPFEALSEFAKKPIYSSDGDGRLCSETG